MALSDVMHRRLVELRSNGSFNALGYSERAVSAADSLGFVLRTLPLACRWAGKGGGSRLSSAGCSCSDSTSPRD